MCLVCGSLVGEAHWAEIRLDRTVIGGSHEESRRRHDRFRRIRLLNRVLVHRRLAVHDEWGATRYVLTNGRGTAEIVDSMGALWPAVERLLGSAMDPLDQALLASLRDGAGTP